jgi:hypothetical protein
MSSLWTPEGEHRVEQPTSSGATSPGAPEGDGGQNGEEVVLTAEEAELRREFEQLEEELLAAPVEDVIANHCYGLFQLAALHLGQRPPNLEQARLAIDAFGAITEALGPRLGSHAESFTDGLAQLRLAYVQLHAATEAAEGTDGGEDEDGTGPE